MIRFIYNLLWPVALLFFLPGYLVKMFRRGGYRRHFGQRLGLYDVELIAKLRRSSTIWMHAVSVGEVGIALKLIPQIRNLLPEQQFVLTTTTTTGFAFAGNNAPSFVQVLYSPLDFWPIMHRALAVIQPRLLVLVEAEIWPNMIALAKARNIPVALVNARLSPRSEQRMRRGRYFVGRFLRMLDLVSVQEPADADRWRSLGVEPERIQCSGSVKYDPLESLMSAADGKGDPPGNLLTTPVLFGASTHRGEEEALGRALLALRSEFPSVSLFVAPRHAERARDVQKQLDQLSLRTKLCGEPIARGDPPIDCLVLDRTGELRRWYAVATVVFVGKSLTAHGGQNPVEPILANKPVIFGRHMENFSALAARLVAEGGALQIEDENTLVKVVARLFRDELERQRLVLNALRVLEDHRGATERTAKLLVRELE